MPNEMTLEPREVKLTTRTNTVVRRTLPHKELKMIGAWCFIDHYGPTKTVDAMSVAAHPHTGLQTVSWLFSGEIEHHDSVGSSQLIHPGQLNLMTSGYGIAHSELSLDVGQELHGVQLWVALPASQKDIAPHFEHHNNLPIFEYEGLQIILMMGEMNGYKSEAITYSPLIGAEISGNANKVSIPLNSEFEYGILIDKGSLDINGNIVESAKLHYLPAGNDHVLIESKGYFRAMLIGGQPFNEEIIMWWNFIGRTHEEIVQMRDDWQGNSPRFAPFEDRIGERIPAPNMPNLKLKPRGRFASI